MQIYTSYFANMRHNQDIIPISIARYSPRWLKCDIYISLAPAPSLLLAYKDNKISQQEYVTIYCQDTLAKLDANDVLVELYLKYENRPIALCCYENRNDFCHRHIVAEWLTLNAELLNPIQEL